MKFKKGDNVLVECEVKDTSLGETEVEISIPDNVDAIYVWDKYLYPASQWIEVNGGDKLSLVEGKRYQVAFYYNDDKEKHIHFAIKQFSGRSFCGCSREVVVGYKEFSPYEPPVKLRESCEVCEHYEQWTEFVCPKTKTVNPHPHWVGNKPCHED